MWGCCLRGWRIKRHELAIFSGLTIVALILSLLPGLGPRWWFDRLPVQSHPFFWAGVNYPWKTYQDFGTGAWGHSGVSDPTTNQEVETDFTNMAAQGIRVAKWRVFNDGRYGPNFDANGFATGLSPEFVADVQAALQIATKHDIYLVFTLFNSQLWTTACVRQGVRFGWGEEIMTDPARRAALLHNGVEPFLRLVGQSDRVIGFEVIAEPEWGIQELHEEDWRLRVPLADVRPFIQDVVRAVHANTKALATVESNRPIYMQAWRGLDLDYYSFSWYDWMAPYDPLDVPARHYGLDQPVVLGEFPVATSEHYTLQQVMDITHRQGYAGVFGWSYAAADEFSRWNKVRQDFTTWLGENWPEVSVSRRASQPPNGDAPVLPPPYARSQASLHVEQGTMIADVELWVRGGGDLKAKFFLYPGDGSSNEALAEQEEAITIADGQSQLLTANFGDLQDGQQYKLSLGIFDHSYRLVKWFDGVSVFTVSNGEVSQPKLTVDQIENPCYGVQ